MSYHIRLRVKVEGHDKYVSCTEGVGISWNARKLIFHSSGWDIKNLANNGVAEAIGTMIEKGIYNLENDPENYRQYQINDRLGTIETTLEFYKNLLEKCDEYPYAYVFVE